MSKYALVPTLLAHGCIFMHDQSVPVPVERVFAVTNLNCRIACDPTRLHLRASSDPYALLCVGHRERAHQSHF